MYMYTPSLVSLLPTPNWDVFVCLCRAPLTAEVPLPWSQGIS